jgi:glucose-1-phosphate cytidylyltransferase
MIEAWAADEDWPEGIEVECLDTGQDTPTGGRIKLAEDWVGGNPFCATYSDGVADIELSKLLAHHAEHGGLATMTVVRPELQFGLANINGDSRVTGFEEKPKLESWINGGFFCFEPAAFDYMTTESVLEREPLEGLAGDGQLVAFEHRGFWDCMDTYKDSVVLNDLWAEGGAPWRVW